MNRCTACNKFASLNLCGPHDTSAELDGTQVSVTLSVSRDSWCCHQEIQTAEIEIDQEIAPEIVEAHSGDGHRLFVLDNMPWGETVEWLGRTYIEVGMLVHVYCACHGTDEDAIERRTVPLDEIQLTDRIHVSLMEAA